MDNSQDINLKDLRAYVEQLEEQRDLLVAEKQDILDKRIEEVLKDGDKTLSERKQRKRDVLLEASKQRYQSISEQLTKIERSLFIAKDALSKELTFRKDLSVSQEELREVQRKTREYEEALAYMKHPAVEGNPAEHAKAMKAVQDAYKALTGEEFDSSKFDEAALKEKVRHVGEKAQHKVDEVFGNVDAGEVSRDKKELESIEKDIAEKTQRSKDYRELNQLLGKVKKLKDNPDFVRYMEELQKVQKDLEAAEKEINDIKKQIDANNLEIQSLSEELAKLEAIPEGSRSKEQQERIDKIKEEIGALEVENLNLGDALEAATLTKTGLQEKANKLKELGAKFGFDAVEYADDLTRAQQLIKGLGLQEGDKPFELTDDIDAGIKFVKSAHRSEKLTAQKREKKERAAFILDKYGVEAPKKGDFAHALDERVAEIKKNYNPAHIQAGWERPGVKKEEAPEQTTEPTTEPTQPADSGNPSGGPTGGPIPGGSGAGPGTGTQGSHGPSMSNGGGTYGHGSPAPTGTSAPVEPVAPTQTEEQENNVANDLTPISEVARGFEKLGEPISGDVDLRTLVDQPGMTKVQNGFVYRVVPMVPEKGEVKDREYQPIREPVDYYFEDTSSKLKSGIKNMIEAIKEMDEDEQARAVDKLSATQKKQMERILKGGFGSRSSEKKFIKDILKRDPKTQVDLLIAYNSSAGLPELMAEATGFLDGNPYQKPTDLIVQTEQPKGLFKRFRKEKLKPVTLENNVENLLDGYKHQGEAPGTRRDNTRRREHSRDKRDVGERD